MDKYPKRKTTRLKNYDYSSNGWYFVTICSYNRLNIFGEYKNIVGASLVSARNNIKLSTIGNIIDNQWKDIPNQYKNVALDQYIIMPNHIHCVLIINDIYFDKREETSPSPTLPDIICSFKSKCANKYLNYLKRNNIQMPAHIWQRSFYDHVIRNDKSLYKIREYIVNNPATWVNDKHNPNRRSHSNSFQPRYNVGAEFN